jgi:hypothetical protein
MQAAKSAPSVRLGITEKRLVIGPPLQHPLPEQCLPSLIQFVYQ